MVNLIKTDFKRIFKDKLFLILCIVGAGLAVFSALLYWGLDYLISETTEDLGLGSMISAKSLCFASFSPMSDFGLIMPIFMGIIISKEFSHGTIRNKIISGCSRTKTYFSLFITSTITICVLMVAYCLLLLGLCSLFLDYSSEPFTTNELFYLFESFTFNILNYILVSAVICFGTIGLQKLGIGFIIHFVAGFLFLIIASVLGVYVEVIRFESDMKFLVYILDFLNHTNIYYNVTFIIGTDTYYTASELAYCILTPTVFAAGFTVLGWIIFKKKDIK